MPKLTQPMLWMQTLLLAALCGLGATGLYAQQGGILEARLRHKNIQLEEGQIVSNLLCVSNPGNRNRSFRVATTEPGGWRRLSPRDLLYELAPGDSAFVPIRLIPPKESAGASTAINVLVFTEEGQQVAQDFFYAESKKRVAWNLELESGSKVYFPGGTTEMDVRALIENQGAFDQDIFVKVTPIGKGLSVLGQEEAAAAGSVIQLNPGADTALQWRVRTEQGERNLRNVSLLSHRPELEVQGRRYSLMVETAEPLQADSVSYRRASRVELLELPNELRVQEYGNEVLPLIVEGVYQNILGQQSVFALNLNGTKALSDDAYLIYFSQLMFRQVYANNPFQGAPWYVGYFDPKYSLEAGTINGAMLGMNSAGRGLKGSWQVSPGHRVGAFYVRGPFIQNPFHQSYGVWHQAKLGKLGMITTRAGRNESRLLDQTADVLSSNLNLRLARNQFLGLTGAISRRRTELSPDSVTNRQGFLAGFNYSSHYLDRSLAVLIGGQANTRYFGSANLERIALNSRITYRINDTWDLFYAGAYNNNQVYSPNPLVDTVLVGNEQSVNNLVLSTRTATGSIQPGVYYNVLNRPNFFTHSRGLNLRYSAMEYNKNFMFTLFAMGGYDRPMDFPGVTDYFTFRFNTLLRVRTLTLSTSYQYGALSSSALAYQLERGMTPQFGRMSINHQYLFRNRRYVMENSGFYTYNNQFRSHTVGLYPRMFYFSNTGWRFEVQFGYTLSSNNFQSTYNTYSGPLAAPIGDGEGGAVVNNNVVFGVGMRKEFGIPIPFTQSKAASPAFVAFYDLNGNGVRDAGETALQDVVISLGHYEVMTDAEGKASIRHAEKGRYRLKVTPLSRLEGWFPNLPDSLLIAESGIEYIPFVRGVKVSGNVYVNRQQIAVTDERPLDLTNIKITATTKDGERVYHALTDLEGNFSFYLPNGTYRISMDESILGSRFRLAQNNLELTLQSGVESVYTSFYIAEKEREVRVKRFDAEVPVIRTGGDDE